MLDWIHHKFWIRSYIA